MLALATGLAAWPLDPSLPLTGAARAPSCGSSLTLGLELDGEGRIARLGMRSHACAIGQAAAALFAEAAHGRDRAAVAAAEREIAAWLAGDEPLPDWPGFAALEPARAYPARHGAILLAWRAALSALSSGEAPG
ncbi:MAG: iron-sulfur cluster assembly scaffold protein [Novosphingobium sp.]|nr:iron-sulfur cluster assembly scaffold protein [Novosphingobium sp.]